MALYYLLDKYKMIDVQNLLAPINNMVFMNNINNGEGEQSKNQYELNNNKIKIVNEDNKYFIKEKINNNKLKIFNIHYQGKAKSLLCKFNYINNNLN